MSYNERPLRLINRKATQWAERPYILRFGIHDPTYLLAYAYSVEGALNECIEYIADKDNGLHDLLCNEMVIEEYNAAIQAGMSAEDALKEALSDTDSDHDCKNHIHSDDWFVEAENPTPKEISDIHHGRV